LVFFSFFFSFSRFILHGHKNSVSSVKFSRDGTLLASASADKTVKLWSASDGQFQWDLVGHTGGLSDVSWSHDSAQLASASDDKTVMIWDVETQKAAATLTGHSNYVMCVAYNPTGNVLASGSFDETIKLWDLRNKSCITTLPAHSDPVCSIDWNKDGTLLASASYDGVLRIWDSQSFACLKTLIEDSNQAVSFVRFAPNGKFLLASTLDSTMRLWSHSDGKSQKVEKRRKKIVFCSFFLDLFGTCKQKVLLVFLLWRRPRVESKLCFEWIRR
jgi:COMPASS component SWD3